MNNKIWEIIRDEEAVWEQRKLGELGSLKNGMNFSKEAMGIGFPFVNLQNIFGNNVIDVTNLGKAMASDSQLKDYNLLNGDVLFVRSSVKLEGVGEAALVPQNLENTTYSGFIIRFRDEYGLDNNFKRFIFGIESVRNQIMAQATNSANKNISQTVLENLCLKIPNKSEQEKIGLYFSNLDKLITLHQRISLYFLKINTFVWEQRKLPEFVSFFNGLTYTPDDVEETGTLVLRSSNVKNGEIVDADNVYVNGKVATSENVQEGDIIVVVRNGSRALIGKHAQIKASMPNTVIGAFMSGMRSEQSSFVNALLDTSAFENEIAKNMGATINQITGYMFSKMEFMIPAGEEQQQIGEYFQSLDHLITLHHRKCEETKILKKYMLQKMFPQNGQKVPEIRFKGFTEDWEQRKLGDLVDRVTRKNQDLVSELPLTISAQYGLIDQNEFFDKRVASKDVSGYYLIENGEFAYNKSTSTDAPWGAIKRLDRYENGVLSTLYIVFRIKENNPVDSDFLVSYYSTNLWHKGIHEIAAEGARNHGLLNIAPADFFETELMIPQDIEEQKKIGKYFEELERLITLHQRKCEELKNIKKFMLQNMFV